jgi:hypothetical protein
MGCIGCGSAAVSLRVASRRVLRQLAFAATDARVLRSPWSPRQGILTQPRFPEAIKTMAASISSCTIVNAAGQTITGSGTVRSSLRS